MSNFTPGPWEKKGNTIFGNGRRICDLLILYDGDWQPWAEEQEANAHLIAAAPRLYEAAQEMITALNGTYLDDKRRAKEHLEQVLAKVEKGE